MNKQNPTLPIHGVMQRFSFWYKQITCEHKEWDCDTQIRVIECKKCKKRAWIRDYRSLF